MDDTELWAEVAKYLGLAGVGTGSGVGIAFVLRWAYRRLFEEGLATQTAMIGPCERARISARIIMPRSSRMQCPP